MGYTDSMIIRSRRAGFFLILLLSFSLPLAAEIQAGIQVSLGAGYPSGKGLWDWTDSAAEGRLHWGPGGAAGAVILYNLDGGKYQIESGGLYSRISAGQSLDSRRYNYIQHSLEVPLLFKQRLPFDKHWYLGIGPALLFIPGESRRETADETLTSRAEQQAAVALQLGTDWVFFTRRRWLMRGSFRFVHPLTSPEYKFTEATSGSIRINRVDIGLAVLYAFAPPRRRP